MDGPSRSRSGSTCAAGGWCCRSASARRGARPARSTTGSTRPTASDGQPDLRVRLPAALSPEGPVRQLRVLAAPAGGARHGGGERPDRAVTFVDNHDFRGGDSAAHRQRQADGVRVHPDAPRIPVRVLAGLLRGRRSGAPADPRGIAALVGAHERNAGGDASSATSTTSSTSWSGPAGARARAWCSCSTTGAIAWNGTFVDTTRPEHHLPTRRLVAAATTRHPEPTGTAPDGRGEFWAPPRGYAVYVPA